MINTLIRDYLSHHQAIWRDDEHITLLARFLHTPDIISATSVLLNKCTVQMSGYFCSRSPTGPT